MNTPMQAQLIIQGVMTIAALTSVPCAQAAVCLGATSTQPEFQSITVAPQSGVFTFEADAIPSAANPSVDAGVGLANTLLTAYSDVAAVLRFHNNGLVDARNGSAYQAENNYAYTLGTTYHVRMVVDVPHHLYSMGYTTLQPAAGAWFNGVNSFVEAPDSDDFSVTTTGALSISAWLRPDTLAFSKTQGSGYVDWLGKGEGSGDNGQQEWYFRMYSLGNTEGRENRISFYIFNPQGGLGIGSHFQDPVTPGQWIHVVGVIDAHNTYLYKDGVLRDCDQYAPGPKQAGCNQYNFFITPTNGTAPLRMGTVDLNSFFRGSIKEVRVWNRALSASEVAGLEHGTVPSNGLVAEYLLEGDIIADTKGSHTAVSYSAEWVPQQ